MSLAGKRTFILPVWAYFMLLSVLPFYSCETINPAEQVPGYVKIDSIRFTTDYQFQGSSEYRFKDAWVYVDNNYLGTYELPITFPVLATGTHKISVRAGIILNGVAATRAAYAKTATFDTLIDLKENATVSIAPIVQYFNNLDFVQMEDFDDGGVSLISTDVDDAQLTLTAQGDTNALEGASGKVVLDQNKPLFEVATDVPFTLPSISSPFIELNYKGDQEFTIGIFYTMNSAPGVALRLNLVNVRSTSDWKKIFLDLRSLAALDPDINNYKVFLRATLPSGAVSSTLYFDNLKVLY